MSQQNTSAPGSGQNMPPASELISAGTIQQFLVEPLNPAENGEIIAQAIRNARHSVWLEVYLLTHPHVLDALVQAATPDPTTGQSKDVRVILEPYAYPLSSSAGSPPTSASPADTQNGTAASPDGFTHTVSSWFHRTFGGAAHTHSAPTYNDVTQHLTSAGAQVRKNQTALHLGGKTHAKLLLIDGQTAYIMTANLTTDALGFAYHNGDLGPAVNREYLVIDQDPQRVQTLAAVFAADWDTSAPRVTATHMQSSALVISPSLTQQGNARDQIVGLINNAQQTLHIEMEEIHETNPQPPQGTIEQALVNAVSRKVVVQLLLPANPTTGKATTQADIDFLKSGGVQVHIAATPTMHAKMILADAQVQNNQVSGGQAFIGSQNLSTAGLDYNREVGILLSDPNVLTTLWQTFQLDWGKSSPA